ncbi:MAG: hypothetical protein ACRBDL_10310 [Alphaproteobacteria bacterium]
MQKNNSGVYHILMNYHFDKAFALFMNDALAGAAANAAGVARLS